MIHALIATIGRPSLLKQIEAVCQQMQSGDTLTVVFDGFDMSQVDEFFEQHGWDYPETKGGIKILANHANLGGWGHGIRTIYQNSEELKSEKGFIWHIDDDDLIAPDAYTILHGFIADTDTAYIFQMNWNDTLIPRKSDFAAGTGVPDFLELGNISTQCVLMPCHHHFPDWPLVHHGDFLFYSEYLKKQSWIYIPKEIYVIRPQ